MPVRIGIYRAGQVVYDTTGDNISNCRTSFGQGPAKQPVGCRLQRIAVRMACTSQDPLRPWRYPELGEWRRNPRMADLLREKNKRLILQELTAEIAFHEKRISGR
jgi:hypothetical protein